MARQPVTVRGAMRPDDLDDFKRGNGGIVTVYPAARVGKPDISGMVMVEIRELPPAVAEARARPPKVRPQFGVKLEKAGT